jgi:simple sugar transport system permease protein
MEKTKKDSIDWNGALREIASGGFVRTLLSVVLGFLVGAAFMIASNKEFLAATGYLFADPMASLRAAGNVVAEGYGALFRGSIFNAEAASFDSAIRPLTESLRLAGPLIAAGLGIALGFRVGLFNIGGTGQMVSGMIWATFVATRLEMPPVLHFVVALVAAIVGASVLGALVGYLKAKTGANEVITTIMLNYVMVNLFSFLLLDQNLLQGAETGGNTKADPAAETARLPLLLGENFSLHLGFILALVAVVVYWWLLERSTIGFRMRAVGFNPSAAKTAEVEVILSQLSVTDQNTLLGLDLGSVCKVVFTPNGVGSPIEKYAKVISIAHNSNTLEHRMSIGLGTLAANSFVLDDVGFGILDVNVLGW